MCISGVLVPIYLSKEDCAGLDLVCCLVTNSEVSSFTETNIENNVACVSVDAVKQCDPRMSTFKCSPKINM